MTLMGPYPLGEDWAYLDVTELSSPMRFNLTNNILHFHIVLCIYTLQFNRQSDIEGKLYFRFI